MTQNMVPLKKIFIEKDNIVVFDADSSQEELYRNLMNLQFHDLSEYRDCFDILEDGKFEWNFGGCFNPKNKYYHPLLIKYDKKIVGFLIFAEFDEKYPELDFQMTEMFILRMYRYKGIGKKAVNMIFNNFKGKYQVTVASKNNPAMEFWIKAIEMNEGNYTKKELVEDGEKYIKLTFILK